MTGATKDDARRNDRKPVSRKQLAAGARRQLGEITGLEAAGVTSLERFRQGTASVEHDLVDAQHVRRLLEYRRVRRYSRGEGGPDGG